MKRIEIMRQKKDDPDDKSEYHITFDLKTTPEVLRDLALLATRPIGLWASIDYFLESERRLYAHHEVASFLRPHTNAPIRSGKVIDLNLTYPKAHLVAKFVGRQGKLIRDLSLRGTGLISQISIMQRPTPEGIFELTFYFCLDNTSVVPFHL